MVALRAEQARLSVQLVRYQHIRELIVRILRHSKIDLTMEVYSEAPSNATQQALRKLGDVLTWRLLHFAAAPRSKKPGSEIGTRL
jgi:hypothetical protein